MPKATSFFENLYDDHRVTREDVELRLIVRKGLEKKAGRPISNSTVFALMARVGKRKFAPYYTSAWEDYARQKF